MSAKPLSIPGHNTSSLASLRALLGDRLVTETADRERHAGDASHHAPSSPDAVAYPESDEEVARLLEICNRHRTPVIPYGTGTGVEGGTVATHGGLCIDLGRMNRIVEVNVDDLDATVQAGVTRHGLNRHLAEAGTGLHFPVGPGTDASLGGMAATRASGTEAVRYGTMRENVLGLTAVLADGRIIRAGGRARKSAAGYDLTRLMVGSEGTLGVITQVTLRLARLPAAVAAAVCAFGDEESAVRAVIAMVARDVPPAKSELVDAVLMDAVRQYSGLAYRVSPALFLEFHGNERSVAEQAEAAEQIALRCGGEDFQWAVDEDERQRLWQARFDAYYACQALRPGCSGYVTDVCVPLSRLAECIGRAKRDLASSDLIAPLFGHVGDGNFHVVILIDPENAQELAEAQRIGARLVDHALDLGGTCSGEHGIGLGKPEALEREAGDAVAVMRDIKRALDPHGIMNPGKVLRRDTD